MSPTGDLVLDDSGNVFGTTATGSQSGTIFQYAPSTNAFRFLFNFNGSGDGAKPQGSLLLKDGKLYGTAASGGANNAGTVYQLNLASASLTTLHVFGGADDGASPYGGVVLQKGKLFGAALQAGAQNGGTLYSLALSSSLLTTLYGLDPKTENSPIGKVVLDGAGVVYGVNELNGKTATGLDIFIRSHEWHVRDPACLYGQEDGRLAVRRSDPFPARAVRHHLPRRRAQLWDRLEVRSGQNGFSPTSIPSERRLMATSRKVGF